MSVWLFSAWCRRGVLAWVFFFSVDAYFVSLQLGYRMFERLAIVLVPRLQQLRAALQFFF